MREGGGRGKPVTLGDVARESGYAVSTVSTALSGGYGISPVTRESIREVAQRLGFTPNPHARSLIKGRSTDTVGLFAAHLDFGVVTRKIQILQSLLAEQNYVTPIYALAHTENEPAGNQVQSMENLLRLRPLAILCNVSRLEQATMKAVERYGHEGGTVVCYDRGTDIDCDHVFFDREDSAWAATRYLTNLGHRKIAFFDAAPAWADSERVGGYRRALAEAAIEERADWLYLGEGESFSMGVRLANWFLELKERPTAICIPDDGISAAFIACLLQHGLQVPRDVSVISHDDMPIAQASAVPLTTISQPVDDIAAAVMALLTDRLQGRYHGDSRRVVLRGSLVERRSAAPPD